MKGSLDIFPIQCNLLSAKNFLFLVEVKASHVGSKGIKLFKYCERDFARREAWTDLIWCMYCSCALLSKCTVAILLFAEANDHLGSTGVKL